MNPKGKPYAPKPIKKINCNLSRITENSLDRNRSKTSIAYSGHSKHFLNFGAEILNEKPKHEIILNKNLIEINLIDLDFENELEKTHQNESAKWEILSILNKNDSTFYKSSIWDTKSENYFEDENFNLNHNNSNMLPSMLPTHSHPFYQNLIIDIEDTIDLNKFNSDKLLSDTTKKLFQD